MIFQWSCHYTIALSSNSLSYNVKQKPHSTYIDLCVNFTSFFQSQNIIPPIVPFCLLWSSNSVALEVRTDVLTNDRVRLQKSAHRRTEFARTSIPRRWWNQISMSATGSRKRILTQGVNQHRYFTRWTSLSNDVAETHGATACTKKKSRASSLRWKPRLFSGKW